MEQINPYYIIISASLIVIISYFFNIISKRTNIPSVLLLITLGLFIKAGLTITGYDDYNWFPILQILGIIGLIMIVLESALELELNKDKTKTILKALLVAFASITINVFVIAKIYQLFFTMDFFTAALYATPISIISSAIVIPSIENLSNNKKEFLIYESTLSDILGIIVFYSLLMFPDHDNITSFSFKVITNFLLTIILAFALSYLMIYISQKLKTRIKLFLFISILILFFAIGKTLHLSSLIIILIYGIVANNRKIFIPKFLQKKCDKHALDETTEDIKLITFETSFIIRTFFFVIFGITLALSSLLDFKVWIISILLLIVIYGFRYIFLRFAVGKNLFPEIFIAPRGLITILLFYVIPKQHQIQDFNYGILFFNIIVTSIIMTIALIKYKHTHTQIDSQAEKITGKTESIDKLSE